MMMKLSRPSSLSLSLRACSLSSIVISPPSHQQCEENSASGNHDKAEYLPFGYIQEGLEKRDIDLETEVREKVELVRDTGSAVKDKLTAVTADSVESLEESADDILPDVDDFSGANDEAAEYFLD